MARGILSRMFLRTCSNSRWKFQGTARSPHLIQSSHTFKWYNSSSFRNKSSQRLQYLYGSAAIGAIGVSSLVYYSLNNNPQWLYAHAKECDGKGDNKAVIAGQYIKDLPVYKTSEVMEHNSVEKGIWITYKNGVYDVTKFIEQHPGGDKILLAAGSSVEPYWLLYGVHNSAEVYSLLEEFRIGNLHAESIGPLQSSPSDPYGADPMRHPALVPASVKPFNGEPPTDVLVDHFYTPNSIFYVRNHLPVPVVDPDKYRLEVNGLGVRKRSFTLSELKKFPKHTVTAAIQCAGNRRSEMVAVKPVKGLSWNQGAIGNATWSGARLTDVLKECNFRDGSKVEHVQFEGLDAGPDGKSYGASVPAEKVLDPGRDVILAYEMNGEELPRDHGYPVRVVVPGIVGARNVKWLSKIVLSDKESDSHWQQSDYKGFSPSVDWDTVDFSKAPAIQELPINSAICVPRNGDVVDVVDGFILLKGYAWSGGGNPVVRVDITSDLGKTWSVAELEQVPDKRNRRWAWTLWTAAVPVDPESRTAEIWVKAVDSSYNTQPEKFEHVWNLRGVLGNAYHKISVTLSRGCGNPTDVTSS